MLSSLSQKRIRLDFNRSDEKEMMKLLADALACLTTAVGQLSKAGDAQVRLLSPRTQSSDGFASRWGSQRCCGYVPWADG